MGADSTNLPSYSSGRRQVSQDRAGAVESEGLVTADLFAQLLGLGVAAAALAWNFAGSVANLVHEEVEFLAEDVLLILGEGVGAGVVLWTMWTLVRS